jgi:hypothetical protein
LSWAGGAAGLGAAGLKLGAAALSFFCGAAIAAHAATTRMPPE